MARLVFKQGKQVTACPHCGSDIYQVAVIFSGRGGYHRNLADGSAADNSGLHDGCNYKELKAAFCADCQEPIGMVRDVPDQAD